MESNENKYEIKPAEIDKDILEVATKQGNILASMSDPKEMNRVLLNCFAELLSEMKHLSGCVDNFLEIITILSADKIEDFFVETKKNFNKEKARVEKINENTGKVIQNRKKPVK